ncbi:MAG: hypothetical protein MK137_08060 [Rickettsiales bacterium]|nr:hypothetical protein [Rickettsiales bacterium]
MKLTFLSALPEKVKIILLVSFLILILWIHDITYSINDVSESVAESCINSEANIKETIAQSNLCSVDADCIVASFPCPFNCEPVGFINKLKAEEVRILIGDYHYTCDVCISDCRQEVTTAKCINGTCQSP